MLKNSIIYIGSMDNPDWVFQNAEIISINGETGVSIVGDELAYDVMETTVDYKRVIGGRFIPKNSTGLITADGKRFCTYTSPDLADIPYACPIYFVYDNQIIGKFYITNVQRETRTQYKLNAVSMIGLFDNETFYGGLYDGNQTLKDVMEQIVLTDGLQLRQKYDHICEIDGYSKATYIPDSAAGWYTMHHRLHTKFTWNGFSQSVIVPSSPTPNTLPIVFAGYYPYYHTSEQYVYCLISSFHRDNPEQQFTTGEFDYLRLYYGDTFNTGDWQSVLLTPLRTGHTYEVDVNPMLQKVTVVDDGVTSEYSFIRTASPAPVPIGYVGGGMKTSVTGAATPDYNRVPNYGLMKWYFTEIYDAGGTKVLNAIPYAPFQTRTPGIVDTLSGIEAVPPACQYTLDNNDMPQYYDAIGFVNPSDAQLAVAASIEYEDIVAELPIYGWLPVCTKREAIHQLLFSQSLSLIKGDDGAALITFLRNTTPQEIQDGAIYNGGSVDYMKDYNGIEVTQHTFSYDDGASESDLFDNSTERSVSNAIVTFSSSPIHGAPRSSGMIVHQYNPNAAMVSGAGKLKGQALVHSTEIVRRKIANKPNGQTASVSDCTLVTVQNSEYVADRMYNFYSSVKKVTNDITTKDEKCGRQYSFTNPFSEKVSGFLAKMAFNVSSVIKTACEWITNYKPTVFGGNYSNAIVLTGTGTWTVPPEVFEEETPRIRVILISGGQGGYSGKAGDTGKQETYSLDDAAEGGEGGSPGAGGRIAQFVIDNPASSYSYACGIGGAGGEISHNHEISNAGSLGTDTTFGNYSTAGYPTSEIGIRNFFNGRKYAYSQNDFGTVAGGRPGGKGGVWYQTGEMSYTSRNGESVEFGGVKYAGGSYGHAYYTPTQLNTGGEGGGAAAGQAGTSGLDGTAASAGAGGKGGDAMIIPPKVTEAVPETYGYGGMGGHGGGGGGCGGYIFDVGSPGAGGAGGYGGRGGTGGDGCIIVYY